MTISLDSFSFEAVKLFLSHYKKNQLGKQSKH